jgi:hypothetical protein
MTRVLLFPMARAIPSAETPTPLPAPIRPAPEHATAPETAKLLKRTLRARFPAVRFSVTLDRGTAYGCANVAWTDGPSVKLVDQIVGPFSGEGFDGSTDCAYHIKALLPDGRQTGLRLISTARHVSPTLARKAAAQVAAYYGIEPPTITETANGYWQVEHDNVQVAGTSFFWGSLIHQAASDRSRYAGE